MAYRRPHSTRDRILSRYVKRGNHYVLQRPRTRIPPVMHQLERIAKDKPFRRNPTYIAQRCDGMTSKMLQTTINKFFAIMGRYIDKYGSARVRFFYFGSVSEGQDPDFWSTQWYGARSKSGLAKLKQEIEELASLADIPIVLYGTAAK